MTITYNIMLLGVLSVMALITLVNMAVFASLGKRRKPLSTPFISVLIPARNEERNIGMCLSTLVEQDYPAFEILVLDDASEDATAQIAQAWTGGRHSVRVLRGEPLPPDWVGKSFACHQLALAAKGDLLLFVDADTVHARECLSASVSALQSGRADLLTVIPHQQMETFWERVLLPLLHFSTFGFLPFLLVRVSKNPRFAMANGQFMLFRREAYEHIGGHRAVRTAIVEDVWLSRLIKKHGFTLSVMDGGEVVGCRMYHSFGEIWNGFSKNLFAGFRYSLPAIAAVIIFNTVTSVLPFVFWGTGVIKGAEVSRWFPLVTWQIGAILMMRVLLAVRFKMHVPSVLLHPLAMSVLIAIALNSCRWVLGGGGSRWKGRKYDFRNEPVGQH